MITADEKDKYKGKSMISGLSGLSDENAKTAFEKLNDFKKLMAYYKCAMREIETKFNVLNEEFSLQHDRNPINSIKTRLKSVESMYEKVIRNNDDFTIDSVQKLNDVAGIRVVCSFIEDVYTLAEAFLRQDDITLIEIKDYIKHPKNNGYRSLHLIVSVPIFLVSEKKMMHAEIQLRTISMDSWASLEHQLRYKKDINNNDETAIEEELLECAQLSKKLDEKMDFLREKMNL